MVSDETKHKRRVNLMRFGRYTEKQKTNSRIRGRPMHVRGNRAGKLNN